jgi:uncharacterized protein (DUF58 family)
VTRRASGRLLPTAALAAALLLAGLALGQPALAVLAAPFALALALGLTLARDPRLRGDLEVERDHVLQGATIGARLTIVAERPAAALELRVRTPEGLALRDAVNPVALRLGGGEPRSLELTLECRRWGAYRLGSLVLRARDPLGLLVYEGQTLPVRPLRVYPREEALRSIARPRRTQAFAGDQVSTATGDGIEFAGVRPFAPGDRLHGINWRATARRGGALQVTERHPERATDIVLFVDAFSEAGAAEDSTLEMTVRAAATLARRYLGGRDRLGLVGFGGVLRWLEPGIGPRQLYRIVDALLDTRLTLSQAWTGVEAIPRRTLPPRSLVLALSPLLDRRTTWALADLAARGFDVAVIEVAPEPFLTPEADERDELARRLWRLRREGLRAELSRTGVATARWSRGEPLEMALLEVIERRRLARIV